MATQHINERHSPSLVAFQRISDDDKPLLLRLAQKYPADIFIPASLEAMKLVNRASTSTVSTTLSSVPSTHTSTSALSYNTASATSESFPSPSRMSWIPSSPLFVAEPSCPAKSGNSSKLPASTHCQAISKFTGPDCRTGICWCTYDFQCYPEGFGRPGEQKRHEERKHEPAQLLTCNHNFCSLVYLHKSDFKTHHEREHSECRLKDCSTTVALSKKVFACGFRGCEKVFYGDPNERKGSPWFQRCQHVQEHMLARKTPADWSYNVLIWNLLHQPRLITHWENIVRREFGEDIKAWPDFLWEQQDPDLMRYRLETCQFGDVGEFLDSVFKKAVIHTSRVAKPLQAPNALGDQPRSSNIDDQQRLDFLSQYYTAVPEAPIPAAAETETDGAVGTSPGSKKPKRKKSWFKRTRSKSNLASPADQQTISSTDDQPPLPISSIFPAGAAVEEHGSNFNQLNVNGPPAPINYPYIVPQYEPGSAVYHLEPSGNNFNDVFNNELQNLDGEGSYAGSWFGDRNAHSYS